MRHLIKRPIILVVALLFAVACGGGGETDKENTGSGDNTGGSSTSVPTPNNPTVMKPSTINVKVLPDFEANTVTITWTVDDFEKVAGMINGYDVFCEFVNADQPRKIVASTNEIKPVVDELDESQQGKELSYVVAVRLKDGTMVESEPELVMPPVEDPPVEDLPASPWLQPGQDEAVRALVGRGGSYAVWQGTCNGEAGYRNVLHIEVPVEPQPIEGSERLAAFYAADSRGNWTEVVLLERDGELKASNSGAWFTFFNRFSANPEEFYFHGGFTGRTEFQNPPCKFTPLEE